MLIVLRFNSLLDAQLCSGVYDRNYACQDELRSFTIRYGEIHSVTGTSDYYLFH